MTFHLFPSPAIIAQIGPVSLHAYGAMYALAAILGFFVLGFLARKKNIPLSNETLLDLIFWTFLGGLLGGRIFYVLVYNFSYFQHHWLQIFAVWKGGMSIHGGLIGGALSTTIFLWRKKLPFWPIVGIMTPAIALGMMLGRLGNFANGELIGRITDVPWGMDFGDGLNRHPAQLYAAGKDFLLFLIFLFLNLKTKLSGKKILGIFLIAYAILRFNVEFFREPDRQVGFIWQVFSLGQLLSIFTLLVGMVIVRIPEKKHVST